MTMIRDKEALGDFADDGYHLKEYDDHVVTVCFKEQELAAFNQSLATPEALRAVCKRHEDKMNGNPELGEIRHCRNCIQWRDTQPFRGNCNKHPWEHDRYSQDASTKGCEDYVDKYTKYQMEFAKEV